MAKITSAETVLSEAEQAEADAIALKKQKQKVLGGFAAALLVVGYFIYASMQVPQGTMRFGLCKTLVELTERYPTTIEFAEVFEAARGARIKYVVTSATGDYRLVEARCFIGRNTDNQIVIEKFEKNGVPLDEAVLAAYNVSIPAVLAGQPNVDLPQAFPSAIRSLRR